MTIRTFLRKLPLSLSWPASLPALLSISLGLLVAPLDAQADPVYSLTRLPQDFLASGINNAGQIVGTDGAGAAIWTAGGVISLGALAPGSEGLAINNRGDIAVTWQGGAFMVAGGALHDLGRLGDWAGSNARGINDAGQVVGNAFYGPGERQNGFIVSGGAISVIPTLGGNWSYAAAVNSSGQVAGIATIDSSDFISPTRHAIVFQGGALRDLGSLGGLVSEAYDLNDAGQVVGMSQTDPGSAYGASHAFLYTGGTMTDLGFLGGANARANGINNAGQVVGWSQRAGVGSLAHGFLYANHAMVDLNSLIDPASGWEITSATDINDAQQILAFGCRLGECTALRLDLISAVPELRPWGMLLAGIVLLGGLRGRAPRSATFK